MFDGNHRSRRQVNLGGGNKNRRRGRESTRQTATTAAHNRNSLASLPAFTAAVETGRQSLLEQTRIKREERRRHQLEEKSATKIQKVCRGWKARQCVAGTAVLGALWQENAAAASAGTLTEAVLQRQSFLLSLRLSPPLLQALPKTPTEKTTALAVDSWLEEHAAVISQCKEQAQANNNNNTVATPYAISLRIVQAALSRLRRLQRSNLAASSFQKLYTILEYYLKDASLLWKRMGGANGLVLLLQSTQECLWWWHAQQPKQEQNDGMVQTLWKWSCQAVNELEKGSALQNSAKALLAATVMGHHTGILNDPACAWWCRYNGTDGVGDADSMVDNQQQQRQSSPALYDSYFLALVEHVSATQQTQQPLRETTSDLKDFAAVLSRVLHGRWHIVLNNALESNTAKEPLPSTALLKFLHHVLTHHTDLAILTSVVVRGEDVKSVIFAQQALQQQQTRSNDEEEDEKMLEEEMEQQAASVTSPTNQQQQQQQDNNSASPAAAAANHKKLKSGSTRKISKQDLQTMPYLERIYQEERQRQKNQTLAALSDQVKSGSSSTNSAANAYAQSLVEMATQIGNPSLWISWGEVLLPRLQEKDGGENMDTTTNEDDDGLSACQLYIQLLAHIMQSTTGLRSRTSASSPFLSQLAFAGGGTMIERLWQAVLAHGKAEKGSSQDILTCTMVTVFCDIFAHTLIALSDEKFLLQYTNVNAIDGTASGKQKVVMAERVIGYLRDLLHEVYWTKPVLLDDVKVAASSSNTLSSDEDELRCMRARFLLSGTKLWGSLYERWCRLVRSTPFCEESAWWFPHMASQEGGNAVVNAAAQRSAGDANGLMDMDVDSEDEEDDDDAMDQSQHDGENAATSAMNAADAENDALANAFRDPKMARVLTCIPQALPFERRVRLFDSLLTADKLKTQDENAEFRLAMLSMMRGEENVAAGGREKVEIRRDRLYDDSMRQLNQLGAKLKKKVQISFVNQHGTQEAGIDGGGVFKEFLDDLIKDAFSIDANNGNDSSSGIPRLFAVTPLETLKVNSALTQDGSALAHYEFLGRVLGKAVYESILVDPQFSLPFLNQLLGKRNSLEDLKNDDYQYYKSLTKLLALKEKEIDDLGLTFETTLGDGSSMRTVELVPGGRSKPVTKANVIQYVHLVSHQRLNVEGAVQTRSFLNGFRDLIPASWVRLFSAYELQKLIGGDDSLRGFDVASLKRAMQYAAGYHPSQPVMQWFWEVLEEFTPEQQRKFLKFMTSCSRQPLLGFSSLDPPPCVQQIRLADQIFEEDDLAVVAKNVPLPTSSTCMNLLKLPNYRNKALLRQKLLAAVESGAGFELT